MIEKIKNAAISAKILKLVCEGVDVRDAIDIVLGCGTFEKLSSDLYHSFRGES